MSKDTFVPTVADELAAALNALLAADDPNGWVSKVVAVNLARIALEHYVQSKKDK